MHTGAHMTRRDGARLQRGVDLGVQSTGVISGSVSHVLA